MDIQVDSGRAIPFTRIRGDAPLRLIHRPVFTLLPGLKLLYRRNVVDLPEFDRQYEKLRVLERKLLRGIGIGSACIALVLFGTRFWG